MLKVVLAVLVVRGFLGEPEAEAVEKRLGVRGVPDTLAETIGEVRRAFDEVAKG